MENMTFLCPICGDEHNTCVLCLVCGDDVCPGCLDIDICKVCQRRMEEFDAKDFYSPGDT